MGLISRKILFPRRVFFGEISNKELEILTREGGLLLYSNYRKYYESNLTAEKLKEISHQVEIGQAAGAELKRRQQRETQSSNIFRRARVHKLLKEYHRSRK